MGQSPLPYKDFTIKARLIDLPKVEKKLKVLNAQFLGVDQQKDTYFKVSSGKLKLREGNIENLITHYERIQDNGLEKTIVYRYDVNPTSDDIAKLFDHHEQLGIIQKERRIYFLNAIKIHIDSLPDGNTFIEIECIDRSNSRADDELKKECFDLIMKLGIPESDLIQTGYFDHF